MTHAEQTKLIAGLSNKIAWDEQNNNPLDSADWGCQEGVVISTNQAKFFASLLIAHLSPAPDPAKDIERLYYMRQNTQYLLDHGYYGPENAPDEYKVQELDKAISDWHDELEQKLIAGPLRAEDVTEHNAARVQTRMKYKFVMIPTPGDFRVVCVPKEEFDVIEAPFKKRYLACKTGAGRHKALKEFVASFEDYPVAVHVDLLPYT